MTVKYEGVIIDPYNIWGEIMERESNKSAKVKKNRLAKNLTVLLAVVISIAMLAACGAKNVYPVQTESNKVTPTDKNPEKNDSVSNYKAAYYKVLEDMVSQYGEYKIDPQTNEVNGLKY